MSKTIRRVPRGFFRSPKGHKQALINEVRHGAIPPDAWDDIPVASRREGYTRAERITLDLLQKGYNDECVAKILTKKFKGLSYIRAYRDVVRWHKYLYID
jgi:hypothetical protein